MRSRHARRRTVRKPSIECLEIRQVMSADPLGGPIGSVIEHDALFDIPMEQHSVVNEPPTLMQHAAPDADFWLDPLAERDVDALVGDIEQMLAGADGLTGLTQVRNDYGFIGTGQTVAIIDSGIAWDHVALGGGLGANYRVVGGWDFAENDANPYDDGPSGSHGTLVSGVIGADRPGTVDDGVATGADLVGLRVFDDAGNGYYTWIENALQWVHQNRNAFDNPITAVNLSLGTTAWNSNTVPSWSTLEDEFAQLKADGIFITVSAGNAFTTYNAAGLSYPAASPYVVPVMSVDDDGAFTYYSQRHTRAIAAPGRSIVSTVPDYAGDQNGVVNDFASYSGTSMSAPYVAGASVLLREAMQFVGTAIITQDTIFDHMMATADQFYDSATSQWYKRLNMQAAVDTLMPVDDYGSTIAAAHNLGTLSGASQISGLIGKLTDADYFRFTAASTGTVTFTASPTYSLAPVWIGGGTTSGANDETYEMQVVAGQTYTIGLSTGGGIGYYDLAIDAGNGPSNHAPVLAAIGNKSVNEGSLLSFTATATDADSGQTRTFSLGAGAPTGATINATTGVFSWTPTESQGAGVYSVTVRVTDNGTPALSDSETISITVNEVNVAPVLGAIGNKTVNEGSLLTFTATATDADSPANTRTFSLDAGAPTGATINATTGVFSWTLTESQGAGVYSVTVRVTDNGTPALSDSETISITVNEVNVAPVLAAIGNKTINEGSLLTFTATATDADSPANTRTFSLGAGAPTGATINATTGVFSWTPTESQGAGVYSVTVRVTDNGTPALSDSETISITVNEVNVAPVLAAIGNKSVNEGSLLSFTATASDSDSGQSRTFSLGAGAPTGATINATTGVFSWTPNASQGAATYNVTVRVTDNGTPALSDSETISITVGDTATSAFPNWGTITQWQTNNLTNSGDQWYRVQASQAGYLTAEAFFTGAAGNIDLAWFDTNLQQLAAGVGASNSERVERVVSPSEQLYLRVSGSNADVDFRITNLVVQVGSAVNVSGTSQNDTISFSGGNSPTITVNGVAYTFASGAVSAVNVDGKAGSDALTSSVGNVTLLHVTDVESATDLDAQAYSLNQDLGLRFSKSYYLNYAGFNEKWVLGDITWYFITPDGSLYRARNNSILASNPLIGQLDASYYADPTLLHEAQVTGVMLDQQMLTQVASLGLHFYGSYYLNWGGWGEKWVFSNAKQWYFITPDGTLYQWSGSGSAANSTVIGNIGAKFHTDPGLLQDAAQFGSFSVLAASQLDQSLDLRYPGNYYSVNWGGLNEKWIRGAGTSWYFITPSGGFYEWSGGGGIANSRLLATFDASYYVTPSRLHNAFVAAQSPSAIPTVQTMSLPVGDLAVNAGSRLLDGASAVGQTRLQQQTVTQYRGYNRASSTKESLPSYARQSQLLRSVQSTGSDDAARSFLEAARTQAIFDLFSTTTDDLDSLSDASLANDLLSRQAVFSLFGS